LTAGITGIMDKAVLEIVARETAAFDASAKQRLADAPPPFFEEEVRRIAAFRRTDEAAFEQAWAALLASRASSITPAPGPGQAILLPDTDFYTEAFHRALRGGGAGAEDGGIGRGVRFASALEHFCDAWEAALFQKRARWELAAIDAMRREFLEELYKKINALKTLGELLFDGPGALGRLWDMNKGLWEKINIPALERYAELWENDARLRDLCDSLGRCRRAEIAREEETAAVIQYEPDARGAYAQKGEITGIRQSNALDSMIPSEIALMADDATEALFFKKYTEKKLDTYDYKTAMTALRPVEKMSCRLKTREYKGPFIICLDTSGSMHGIPEIIAKTFCFALVKIALRDKRRCYIISFSTGTNAFDASNLNDNLAALTAFLAMSFHGGTDASAALGEALGMLREEAFRKADVVVASDFIMGELDGGLMESVAQAKRLGAVFHGFAIGQSANPKALACWDYVWQYGSGE